MFWKFLQNLQENTCVGESLLKIFAGLEPATLLKGAETGFFPVNLAKFLT